MGVYENPVLLFLGLFENTKNLKNTKDFPHHANPWKSWKISISKQGSTPTPWARGLRDPNPKMGAPDPENPLFLGFSVLRGGSRPWSQTMVSEGARPWGRGRSGDCESRKDSKLPRKIPARKTPRKQKLGKEKKDRELQSENFGLIFRSLISDLLDGPLAKRAKAIRWTCVVIFFSLTEAPLPDPAPTPPNTPKRTRNGAETDPKRSQTDPNGAEMDRNQTLSGGTAGGVCRGGGGSGL